VTGYIENRGAAGEKRLRAAAETSRNVGTKCLPRMLTGSAQLMELPRISDQRGHLSFAEIRQALPFAAARYFLVFGVPSREVRGEHAHRTLSQFLVCVRGSCTVRLLDGAGSDEVVLDRPDLGLSVPPMIWTTQYKYSSDAVLLVLASDVYREDDYIRDLDEFLALRKSSATEAKGAGA